VVRAGYRIGLLATLMLVLLRIAIGWHFLYEGMWKYKNPSFSAEGFLRQARGPWAEKFHSLVPDYDGRERLDATKMSQRWDEHRRLTADHYNFSEEQSAEATRIQERYQKQLEVFFDEIDTEEEMVDGKPVVIDAETRYFEKLDALAAAREADPTAEALPFQQKRYFDEETKLRKQATGWLAEIDRLERDYKNTLASLADKDQRQRRGSVSPPKSDLEKVDMLTTYGLMAIGAGLILGLFTRLFCVAGAVFLASIILAQPAWPTLYPPLPPSAGHSLVVNKEFIEMLAMLALATMPVGRWAGLDFFVYHLLFRPRRGGKGKRHASHA
jgi:uncharacterized membrane protein YphA (DoxX/SURF4 family)